MTLGYLARGIVQALAAHFIVSSLFAIGIAVTWRALVTSRAPGSVNARRLFAMRMAPAVAGLGTALLVAVGYGVWEVQGDHEAAGAVAVACAVGGLLLLCSGIARAIVAVRHTWRVERLLAGATEASLSAPPLPAFVIDARFPVVALVGLVVSRLFVARRVIEACSSEELDAVVAHEQAHARRHDNLRRLAMAAAPDWLGLVPSGRHMHGAWMIASELAADEWAARRSEGGLHLASALVKVARLATTPAAPLTASALYRGEPITERVHRLLNPTATAQVRPYPTWACILASALLLGVPLWSLPALHRTAEAILKLGLAP